MLSYKAKSPAAIIIYGGDFASQLAKRPAGTTIVSVGVTVVKTIGGGNTNLALDTPFLYGATIVSVKVSGGNPGVSYVLQFSAPLSNGETLVGTITLPISLVVPT